VLVPEECDGVRARSIDHRASSFLDLPDEPVAHVRERNGFTENSAPGVAAQWSWREIFYGERGFPRHSEKFPQHFARALYRLSDRRSSRSAFWRPGFQESSKAHGKAR
jgi:hypothetical protein